MATFESHVETITRYVDHGLEPGSGTRAILENDLLGACQRLDLESQALLAEIVKYLYNNVPMQVWGSPERVQRHINNKRKQFADRIEQQKGEPGAASGESEG